MAVPGMAFGRPLRDATWRKLPVRQRFALEVAAFTAIEPDGPKSLSAFWHSFHVPELALLARADCRGFLNVCLNANDPSVFAPALAALLWCSGVTILRDTDDTALRRSMCMVPVPPDFATFEDDPEFQGLEPPAVLAAGSQFDLTSGMIETVRGPAAVAMGMIPIHERLFDWLYGDGTGAYDSGRVFLGTFLPPTFVEAAFLNSDLFYHRSTGLLPTFVGACPWIPDGPATSHTFRLPYVEGCTVAEMAAVAETRFEGIDSHARMLASLIDRATTLYAASGAAATDAQWDGDKIQWELTQRRFLEDVLEDARAYSVGTTAPQLLEASLTVHLHSNVPRGGTWTASIPQLEADIDKFKGTARGAALRRGPFSFAQITL